MLTSCVQAYLLSLLAFLLSLLLILPLVLITKYDLKIDLAQGLITTSCLQVRIVFIWCPEVSGRINRILRLYIEPNPMRHPTFPRFLGECWSPLP